MKEIEGLAAQGWRLLPCAARGKTPLLKRWQVMASSDLASIREWAAQSPNCNWGVATGPGSRVFVLDVDGEEGRLSLGVLQAQYSSLPVTLTSITGRTDGGEQRFFRYPIDREIRCSAGKIGLGLDIRGAGGYVIVPPSVHPNGPAYRWANPGQQIAEAPRWLLDLLSGKGRTINVPRSAHTSRFVEGERNDALFRFGCAMRRRGASQEEIKNRLLRKDDRECDPPLGMDEICKIAANAAKYEPGGLDLLETAWEIIRKEANESGYGQFVALARQLQLARPGLPIALPLERIGGLMECDWTQVRRWRTRAVRDGWIRLKEKYIPHVRATTYTFHEILASTVPLRDVPLAESISGLVGHVNCASNAPRTLSEDYHCKNLSG